MTALPYEAAAAAHAPLTVADRHRQSWRYAGAVALMTGAAAVSMLGGLFEVAFPAAALAVGLMCYRTGPHRYLTFVWWLWLLTPGIRRIVDGHAGWNPQNPVLLAPLVVSLLAAGTAARRFTTWRRRAVFPFAL